MKMAAPLSPLPPTVADRDAEIAALQTAFDEYIASSRELEDELDAELAKMRKYLYQFICNKFLWSFSLLFCHFKSHGKITHDSISHLILYHLVLP